MSELHPPKSADGKREFWIHDFPKNDVTPWDEPVAYKRYTNTHSIPDILPEKYRIHVIDIQSYNKAVAALKEIRYLDIDPYNHHEDASKCAICKARETLKELGEI